jgi:2-polyprenyl-3-methyl-5-hydroxy-6-metoxy-1,4-benzoquinol methylase
MNSCEICENDAQIFLIQTEYTYYQCSSCQFIFLGQQEAKKDPIEYDQKYWQSEISSSVERAKSSSIARFLELLVLAPIPVYKFLDIGTGGGQFLDELEKIFGSSIQLQGIELYPPKTEFRSAHPGYSIGHLQTLKNENFDVITSIEVLEHLNPMQASEMFGHIARLLNPGGLALINSGNDQYVKNEDIDYLDAKIRGHNHIYSMAAIEKLIQYLPLKLICRENSNWSFFLQKIGTMEIGSIRNSLWDTHPYNRRLLFEPFENEILFMLGRESARVYL